LGLPGNFVRKETPWETLWGPFFLLVTVLLPVVTFPLIAKGLLATCAKAGWGVIIMPLVFSSLWGLGSMFLGMSFAFIGLADLHDGGLRYPALPVGLSAGLHQAADQQRLVDVAHAHPLGQEGLELVEGHRGASEADQGPGVDS